MPRTNGESSGSTGNRLISAAHILSDDASEQKLDYVDHETVQQIIRQDAAKPYIGYLVRSFNRTIHIS